MSVHQRLGTIKENWFYRFTYKRQDYCEGGFRIQAQAIEAERLKRDDLIDRELHPDRYKDSMTFEQAVKWWLTHIDSNKSNSGDAPRLKIALKFFGQVRLSEIKTQDINRFLDALPTLTPRRIGPSTRNHYLVLIKGIFNRLKKWDEWQGKNPADAIEILKFAKAKVRFLYPYEEKVLSPAVRKDPEIFPYYMTALHTGMRVSEMIDLAVKDIDLLVGQIYVKGKGEKSRYVPVSDGFKPFLLAQLGGKNPADKVLPHLTRYQVTKRLVVICKAANVQDFTTHSCRHTFAARLLGKGQPLYQVSKILGHSSQKVTEDHYGHLAFQDLQAAIQSIDGVVRHSGLATDLQLANLTEKENVTK